MNHVALLQQLVRIKSYSGKETELARFLMECIRKNRVDPVSLGDDVFVHLDGENGEKALIFDTHMDTVQEGDCSLWKYPPFGRSAGIIEDGKLYGLGASDAKASIASFLLLLEKLVKEKPACDIYFVFVTQEETGGAGTQKFIKWWEDNANSRYQQVAAVIGEPTGLKKIEIRHRGNVFLKVTVIGDSSHSACSDRIKHHAIEKMGTVISFMNKLNDEWKKDYTDELFGSPSICLTGIGTPESTINSVPGSCWTTWDIRTTPKLHEDIYKGHSLDWSNTLSLWWDKSTSGVADKLRFQAEQVYSSTPGFTDEEEYIVKVLKKVVSPDDIGVSSGSSDLCCFSKAGIPAVVFGPGHKAVIHKENEYIIVENVIRFLYLYKKIIDLYGS